MVLSEANAQMILFPIGGVGLLFGLLQVLILKKLKHKLCGEDAGGDYQQMEDEEHHDAEGQGKKEMTPEKKVMQISKLISDGANSFLFQEYLYCCVFIVAMCVVLYLTVEKDWVSFWTTGAFFCGSVTSIVAGWVGMKVAVYSNGIVALEANDRGGCDKTPEQLAVSDPFLARGFLVAFRAGSVMGFVLTSLGLLVLLLLLYVYNTMYADITYVATDLPAVQAVKFANFKQMYESIAGFGLGGSSIALFGRVGGGIYTKAADVGADLVGKVEAGLDEDSPKNPGTIADNVGDNVGDVAGMGADLFGSFAEATSATMVVSSTIEQFWKESPGAMYFPVIIFGFGIIACLFTTFFATNVMKVDREDKVEKTLKWQLIISTLIMTPLVWLAAYLFLPAQWLDESVSMVLRSRWMAFVSVCVGLWGGLFIGFVTEYYTSYAYQPTQEVAHACDTGAATNIIYGLALGYLSCIVPVIVLAIAAYAAHKLLGMYGIGLAALGMLSTLACGLTIDAYGPISDNAGGIAEMSCLGEATRHRTDALDAAGNTTAAIGKGFAIGSAALVAMALFGAFITRQKDLTLQQPLCDQVITVTDALIFSGLLIGAMLPYAFSAMTMKSVGKAALDMVTEIRRQIAEEPGILEGTKTPDYERCIQISTDASLREMIWPGVLVMGTPILLGCLFGPKIIAGLLPGATTSGIQMAISASNTGGSWDNAKKFIEANKLSIDGVVKGKGTDVHKAAVIGDTVGDPLKDTSGPSLNILIKLSAIVSLVFAKFFDKTAWLSGVLGEDTKAVCQKAAGY